MARPKLSDEELLERYKQRLEKLNQKNREKKKNEEGPKPPRKKDPAKYVNMKRHCKDIYNDKPPEMSYYQWNKLLKAKGEI